MGEELNINISGMSFFVQIRGHQTMAKRQIWPNTFCIAHVLKMFLFYFEIFEDSHAVISYGENPCAFT